MYMMLVPRKATTGSYEEFVRNFMEWWEEQISKRNGRLIERSEDRTDG